MDEFGFIASLLAPLAVEPGALALKDDAAVLNVPQGWQLVITKDVLIAGVHFIGNEAPSLIARKAVAVNLSDLAAMGAVPTGYFLGLMLPSSADDAWLENFASGLRRAQDTYDITLMGGDTTRTPGPLSLSVTALGLVPQGEALLRKGAKVGDGIYASGTLGDAALGLLLANGTLKETDDFLVNRFRLPQPRLKLGQALRGIASACMDISDGLAQDMGHICSASGVGAQIAWEKIPLSPQARKLLSATQNRHHIVLAGGDDYELLFTASNDADVQATAQATDTLVTRIGSVIEGDRVTICDANNKLIKLAQGGYRHF